MINFSPTKGTAPRAKLSVGASPSKKMMTEFVLGVAITDEETITEHLDRFCRRIRQVMDVINTMAQYKR